jgi:hypothetical protein
MAPRGVLQTDGKEHRQRSFFIFLILCRVPTELAPGKGIFLFFFKKIFVGCLLSWHPAKGFFYFFLKKSLPGAS